MTKYIAVADSYALYAIEDDAFELMAGNLTGQPPQIMMELLVLSGAAKKIGNIGSSTATPMMDEEDEDPPEGEGPWVE